LQTVLDRFDCNVFSSKLDQHYSKPKYIAEMWWKKQRKVNPVLPHQTTNIYKNLHNIKQIMHFPSIYHKIFAA